MMMMSYASGQTNRQTNSETNTLGTIQMRQLELQLQLVMT